MSVSGNADARHPAFVMLRRCARVPLLAVVLASGPTAVHGQENVRLMGYLENAKVVEADVILEAKLDTGADNSSIHAPDREFFEKSGEQWVRFTIEGSKRGRAELEKKVERIARIEQRVGVNAERPVVFMSLCVGDIEHVVEVNLADRTRLSTPLLIGRSFLQHGVLVNSADTFTVEPDCGMK